jgi:DNA-directed RNA polymerase subunit RPC12/RpoP
MQSKRRLYECDQCHAKQLVHWVELNRAAKPRCNSCGCSILNPVSAEAVKEIQEKQSRRVEGTGGSLKLAGHLEPPPRKTK